VLVVGGGEVCVCVGVGVVFCVVVVVHIYFIVHVCCLDR